MQRTAQDTPKPSSQHKGDLSTPEEQKAGNKGQRHRQETEDEGGGEKNKGREGDICPEGQSTASR